MVVVVLQHTTTTTSSSIINIMYQGVGLTSVMIGGRGGDIKSEDRRIAGTTAATAIRSSGTPRACLKGALILMTIKIIWSSRSRRSCHTIKPGLKCLCKFAEYVIQRIYKCSVERVYFPVQRVNGRVCGLNL